MTVEGELYIKNLKNEKVDWEDMAYTCAVGNYGLVTDRYRFTKLAEGGCELYDLKKDPYELTNLISQKSYVEVELDLKAKLHEWMILQNDYVPLPISDFNPFLHR